eukprot:14206528-Alexandrium_andersonii.AAC.1
MTTAKQLPSCSVPCMLPHAFRNKAKPLMAGACQRTEPKRTMRPRLAGRPNKHLLQLLLRPPEGRRRHSGTGEALAEGQPPAAE